MPVLFTLAACFFAVLGLVLLIAATVERSYELLIWGVMTFIVTGFLTWGTVREMTRRH